MRYLCVSVGDGVCVCVILETPHKRQNKGKMSTVLPPCLYSTGQGVLNLIPGSETCVCHTKVIGTNISTEVYRPVAF